MRSEEMEFELPELPEVNGVTVTGVLCALAFVWTAGTLADVVRWVWS